MDLSQGPDGTIASSKCSQMGPWTFLCISSHLSLRAAICLPNHGWNHRVGLGPTTNPCSSPLETLTWQVVSLLKTHFWEQWFHQLFIWHALGWQGVHVLVLWTRLTHTYWWRSAKEELAAQTPGDTASHLQWFSPFGLESIVWGDAKENTRTLA